MDKLREIVELFGGGPLAAFIGLLTLGVVALFVALQLAQREHRTTLEKQADVADRLATVIADNTRALDDFRADLEEARRRAQDRGRQRTRTGEAHGQG